MLYGKIYTAIVLALALEADAFWRLPCRDRVAVERVDPLVFPGKIGGHVHTVMGPNSFNANATNDDLKSGTCSSCQVKQDKSAYWTPALYFQHAGGQFEIVPQTGGMLVYYLQRGDDVTAFPPGFRMLAGDPFLRSFPYKEIAKSFWTGKDRTEGALRQKAVGFNCLNYKEPANAALGLRKMPDDLSRCKDGLRAEVFFPSCWDGIRLDSADHKDHMRYPSLMDDGECPETHPVRLVSLFFETIWSVDQFTGQPGRFVWSPGDPTGYGYHGDFMNGWDQDTLEKAVAECRSFSGIVEECEFFDFYTVEEMQRCKAEYLDIKEDVIGPMAQLPGCNPVQDGPLRATKQTCSLVDVPKEKHESLKQTTIAFQSSVQGIIESWTYIPSFVQSSTSQSSTALLSCLSSSIPEAAKPTATAEAEMEIRTSIHLVIVTVTLTTYVDVYAEATQTPTDTLPRIYPIARRRAIHRHHNGHSH